MTRRSGSVELGESTRRMLDRSNTNPICETCGYRTIAIDRCRCACPSCGVIAHDERRIIRHLCAVFGGRVVIEVRGHHGLR